MTGFLASSLAKADRPHDLALQRQSAGLFDQIRSDAPFRTGKNRAPEDDRTEAGADSENPEVTAGNSALGHCHNV
jgi:hypothetical protein